MSREKKRNKSRDADREDSQIGNYTTKSPPAMGCAAESTLRFQKDLFEEGRKRAVEGGDYREDTKQMKSLVDHAEAMAREQAAEIFNPRGSLHDQVRQEKFDKVNDDMKEVQMKLPTAEDEYRKRADALAALGEPPSPPGLPWYTFIFGVMLIAITVSPALHDFFFFDIENQRLAWLISLMGGAAAGLFVAWCLLGSYKNTASVGRYVGFIAGIIFSISLLIIRLVGSGSIEAVLLAIGLALLEVSTVIYLDWEGRGLRIRYKQYKETIVEFDRRRKLRDASAEEVATLKEKVKDLESKIQDHINHLYDRESRAKQVDKLVESAKKAILDGNRAGLAECQGKLLGIDFRKKKDDEDEE